MVADRGLVRANTLPGTSSDYNVPTSAVTDKGFKRSITERRKGNKGHGVAEKISNRKKVFGLYENV